MNEIVLRAQGISNHVFGPEWGPQVYTVGHSLAMIVLVLVPVLLTVLYYQLVERWVIGWIQVGGFRCIVGQTHGVIAVEHTSIPARRNRVSSAMLSSACAAVGP